MSNKLTKSEAESLIFKVDTEGFGYYMLNYGPDIDLLVRLGFNEDKINESIELFNQIENKIMELEENYEL